MKQILFFILEAYLPVASPAWHLEGLLLIAFNPNGFLISCQLRTWPETCYTISDNCSKETREQGEKKQNPQTNGGCYVISNLKRKKHGFQIHVWFSWMQK